MRITGGQYKNRKLNVPVGDSVRPTSDRARQSLFNMLHHAKWAQDFTFDNAHVLDLFCGSGGLGLEALSHGAHHCTFVDQDTTSVTKNANFLPSDDYKIIRTDAVTYNSRTDIPFDLVFMDAPYRKNMTQATLENLLKIKCLSQKSLVIIETEKELDIDLKTSLETLDTRTQGQSRLHILRYHAAI